SPTAMSKKSPTRGVSVGAGSGCRILAEESRRMRRFSAIAGLAWPQGGSETILLRDEPRGYAPAADLVRRSRTGVKGRASTRSRGADEPSRHGRRTVLGAAVVALFLVGLAWRLVILARPR